MSANPLLVSFFSIFGSVIVACLGYIFTKWKEREADWRKERLNNYKVYISSLNMIMEGHSTEEGQSIHRVACNSLNLIAPQSVICAVQEFEKEIKTDNKNKSRESHDRLLSNVLYEMRKDLNISPADNKESFLIHLWAPGKNQD